MKARSQINSRLIKKQVHRITVIISVIIWNLCKCNIFGGFGEEGVSQNVYNFDEPNIILKYIQMFIYRSFCTKLIIFNIFCKS